MKGEEVERLVRALLGELSRSDVSALGRDEDLVEHLGLDSLQGLSFLAAVEKRFQVRFPDELLAALRSVGALVEGIQSARKEPVA
ncbi:MAG: acyl carrier protein [Planctomycetes bacterium]|nr:acyl carrier protein [Planctomycetota bacterium]